MNDNLDELRKKLNTLDCSQNNIQKASEEFLSLVQQDESRSEDLVKMWKFYCTNKTNKLAYIFLANDIIQNSFFQKLKLHGLFFYHLTEVFPMMFNSLSEKIRKEIIRVIDIWEERSIYETSKLENLRQLLNVTTIPNSNTLENPLFQSYMKNNSKIKISEKIKEFAQNLEDFTKYSVLINKLEEQEMAHTAQCALTPQSPQAAQNAISYDKNFANQNMKKYMDAQHLYRGGLLKNAADTIKKQNQVYFKHVYYLQEIDKLLDKIDSFKKSYGVKSDTNEKLNEMNVD
jgi:hypothetical protein